MSNGSSHQFTPPTLDEGSNQALHLESTVQDLPLYRFQIESDRRGAELAQVFEQNPLLPGAILVEQEQLLGMISRQRLLEYLIRPHGIDFFLKEPLRVLYSYARSEVLLLLGNTPIIVAAQQALRRSPEFIGEPILVQIDPQSHYLLDVHSLNIAYWQIRGIETQVRYERAQAQMIQSDKMASLGRLVDGVAHEILDPVSFIWGNLSHVTAYSECLLQLLAAYEKHLPNPPREIVHLKAEIELDYLRQDLPQTIESIRSGADRLSKLATSLQNFCHIDEVYPKPADLHELLDSILLLLKSHLTSEIQVNKHYDHLPPVLCYAGLLNQVFMNILSNAVNALINQAVSQQVNLDFANRQLPAQPITLSSKPTIEITTRIRSLPNPNGNPSRWVSICIADNGPGLSPEAQKQILESFSVKKRAAKETSLALSYQIITAKHGGKLEVRSRRAPDSVSCSQSNGETVIPSSNEEPGDTGTEFEILLPLT
ncbi:sensor histidine kinase [Kovacikia minuta CCNUW1]|uniref:sensor histidine kinase n=1 Tax=Kovacikia minuta TaxID=2931930 RepID=UPI001CCE5FF0|nr:ATP-binding protein [Kovacikia minuta]UBF25156.1 sensor histidine kinase [Kovacikia minuta CCNUW1]